MLWFDTNNDLMKMRNQANSAWVVVAKKDGSGWTPYASGQAIDNRYAHRSNNLSDLGSATTARANLGAAALASPTFAGVPIAPTAATGTNTNQIATTGYVRATAHPLARAAGGGVVGTFRSIAATSGAALVLPAGGTWIYFYLLINAGGNISGHLSGHAAGGSTIYGGAFEIQAIGWAWRKA